MQLKRKELRTLIESMLNEEDMFSAARKAMGSVAGGQEDAAASEIDYDAD